MSPVYDAGLVIGIIIGGIYALSLLIWTAIGIYALGLWVVRRVRRRPHVPGLPADGDPLEQWEDTELTWITVGLRNQERQR